MRAGVKNESWDDSLAESSTSVNLAYDILLEMGKRPFIIHRVGGKDDEGDILLFSWAPEPDSHMVYGIRHVDVKRNANWTGEKFPFSTVYLTANNQLHSDWLYIVFSADLSRVGFIDMRLVDSSEVGSDQTQNRRGGNQDSQHVPARSMKQYDVSRWIK